MKKIYVCMKICGFLCLQFVLLVGDSHLRAIADGIVPIELDKDSMSFGVMCTPGASAAELTQELLHADVPRTPDAVCLLAPSNNLTSSRTFEEAGASFANFVACACSRWPKVAIRFYSVESCLS